MKIFGLIVGIDRYDQPDWDTAGPCRNAIAAAQWLRTITSPKNITLFIDTAADFKAELDALRKAGVTVTESATAAEIDTFCFGALKERPANSRLFVFWSGHGYVSNDGHRVFICRDYTALNFRNRTFNASLFLRHLRSAEFSSFTESLLMADVCGTHPEVRIESFRAGPDNVGDAEQLYVFATPEGQYAHGEEGRGVFTEAALATLGEFTKWPNLDKLSVLLDERLQAAGQKPFRVSISRGEDTPGKVYGAVPGTKLVRDLFQMLEGASVPPGTYQSYYRRTVNRLRNPALFRAQGLSGMIGELTRLQDASSAGVSWGLLHFLVHLTQVEEVKPKIDAWIETLGGAHASTLVGLFHELKSESEEVILLIELEHTPQGDIAAFEPYLRNQNLEPVNDPALVRTAVTNWNDFGNKLSSLIGSLHNITQLHFLADPPLFDRAFHSIPLSGGSMLGKEFIVVLRHSIPFERHFYPKSNVSKRWKEYGEALLHSETHKIKIIPVPKSPTVLTGSEQGFCYFTRLMPAATEGTLCSLAEKEVLQELLRLGIPYICWVHGAGDAKWAPLLKSLKACMKKSQTLDAFPEHFLAERINNKEFAAAAALLWDDPAQKLFQ